MTSNPPRHPNLLPRPHRQTHTILPGHAPQASPPLPAAHGHQCEPILPPCQRERVCVYPPGCVRRDTYIWDMGKNTSGARTGLGVTVLWKCNCSSGLGAIPPCDNPPSEPSADAWSDGELQMAQTPHPNVSVLSKHSAGDSQPCAHTNVPVQISASTKFALKIHSGVCKHGEIPRPESPG